MKIRDWLPPGKKAAVCLTVDDVHPGKTSDAYEAGGDLNLGILRHLEYLIATHSQLKVTLFVTPDWRMIAPRVSRKALARIPYLCNMFFLVDVLPKHTMRLDRHPEFIQYLQRLPRTDVAIHGLHHVRRGLHPPIEFLDASYRRCLSRLQSAIDIFECAGLDYSRGFCPPHWECPQNLARAMKNCNLKFLASARDIRTPIGELAVSDMSGLRGMSLCYPQILDNVPLVHFTTNFQATSDMQRAIDIIEVGGLLCIKAHAAKNLCGHILLDGLDQAYTSYIHQLICKLEDRYGSTLWWTTMAEMADRIFDSIDGKSTNSSRMENTIGVSSN